MDKIPILRMGPFLLVTIQVDLYDRLALNLEADLVQMVSKTDARGVLIRHLRCKHRRLLHGPYYWQYC
jgi:rsbT antagonist protein RsbS